MKRPENNNCAPRTADINNKKKFGSLIFLVANEEKFFQHRAPDAHFFPSRQKDKKTKKKGRGHPSMIRVVENQLSVEGVCVLPPVDVRDDATWFEVYQRLSDRHGITIAAETPFATSSTSEATTCACKNAQTAGSCPPSAALICRQHRRGTKEANGCNMFHLEIVVPKVDGDICGICKNGLAEPCIVCEANSDTDSNVAPGHSTDCPLVVCNCGISSRSSTTKSVDLDARFDATTAHVYHAACITQWLRTLAECPLGNGPWTWMSSAVTQPKTSDDDKSEKKKATFLLPSFTSGIADYRARHAT
jgi:hypothetical protein